FSRNATVSCKAAKLASQFCRSPSMLVPVTVRLARAAACARSMTLSPSTIAANGVPSCLANVPSLNAVPFMVPPGFAGKRSAVVGRVPVQQRRAGAGSHAPKHDRGLGAFELLAQFVLGALQDFLTAGRQIFADAVDVVGQHRQRRPVRIGLAAV